MELHWPRKQIQQKTNNILLTDSNLRNLLKAWPAAPREVQDHRELVLSEQAAAVLQTAGQVLVVNEDKLQPDTDARLSGTNWIREPL